MSLIRPFAGLRPAAGYEDAVLAPPYDVLSRDEAAERAQGKPWSFLHVSKAEIDLPSGIDPCDAAVYERSRANFLRMIDQGVLLKDDEPCYYVYRLDMGSHTQTGLVAAASVAAYDAGHIKRHEFTRPAKEDDRVRQITALNAQTGPVLLFCRADQLVGDLLADVAGGVPAMDVTAGDGVRHRLWPMKRAGDIAVISAVFEDMQALYVADGHHRSAAASRVAAAWRGANASPDDALSNYFLGVIFPHDQMKILDYNRVVRDLNGMQPMQLLGAIAQAFDIDMCEEPVRPQGEGEFGMYLDDTWYLLRIHEELIPRDDPVGRLDVSLLQAHLLAPLLGIGDPRSDERIDFVGGIRGLGELEKRVCCGEMAVAFSLYPTSMQALMAVADAGEVMPPKSTWFEPKLADGAVSLMLD